MSIDTLLNHLSEEEKQPPAYYPLDLAIQYIAYNHKPISVSNARIIYKDEPEDLEKLKKAQKEIQIFLLNGKIKSHHHSTRNAFSGGETEAHQPTAINTDAWSGEMNWHDMCLNYADKECDLDLYFYDIEVCTNDLLTNFPNSRRKSSSKKLKPRERNTLLKMIIGMAVDGYGFDRKEKRSSFPKELEGVLDQLEISVSDDTIRKWIHEAAEMLPQNIPYSDN